MEGQGCAGQLKLCISSQLWTSDEHEVTRGLRRRSKKNCMSTQFGMSDENEMTRGLSSSHSQQLFSAIILLWSGVGGKLLSPCCCGQGLAVSYDSSCCCGQGLVVSYYSSSCCGHWLVVSYYSSCCCGQGLVASYLIIILLWSGVGGQLFDHCLTVVRNWWSSCCGQELVVILLWSGVGGQLCTRSLEGPFRNAWGKL